MIMILKFKIPFTLPEKSARIASLEAKRFEEQLAHAWFFPVHSETSIVVQAEVDAFIFGYIFIDYSARTFC